MMLLAVVLCAVVCACNGLQEPQTARPVVRYDSSRFEGSWMRSIYGRLFQAYRGIRYAEPPVGPLRFQAPVMIRRYNSSVDATEDGPACPQPVEDDYPVSEDCLRLNIYTPDVKKSLPVVVFIHAGGFYSLSGRSDVAGPHHLLERDLVLVTINYRLGTLGFISTGDKYAPGNFGFKDQVAALKWVQRNIAEFGGDPHLVTLAGYSAGSFSVMLHLVSPMSEGLFHRAISMSGSPISQMVIPQHQHYLAEKQARLLNCPTENSMVIIECLRTKTAKEIGDSLDQMFEFGYDPVLMWMPVQEEDFGQERFLIHQPLHSLCNGDLNPVPYIISQTQDEFFWKAFTILENATLFTQMRDNWRAVAPTVFHLSGDVDDQADKLQQHYLSGREIANDTFTAEQLGKLYSDAIIGFGVHRLVNLMARHSTQPVYYYEFKYIGKNSHYVDPVTNKPIGAAHHDDLIYLFNVSASFPSIPVSDTEDTLMVDKMTGIWWNFIRYGNPNFHPDTLELNSIDWPAFKPEERKYLIIDKKFSVGEDLFEDRFNVWEKLFPINYQTCRAVPSFH